MGFATILAVLLTVSAWAQSPQSWNGAPGGWGPFTSRHITHAASGAAIGALAANASEKLGHNPSWWDALFWALLAGLIKEDYDQHHGGRGEWGDVAYTTAGGLALGLVVHWNHHPRKEFATAPKLGPITQ